jgi:hypothetical protein
VSVGLSLGGSYVRQDPGGGAGRTDERLAHLGVLASATVELAGGFYSGLELDAIAYFRLLPPQGPDEARPTSDMVLGSTPFALRLDVLLLGKRW